MSLEVEYKGTQIARLTADGSLTLETAGTWCEGDIELTYSGGGSGGADPEADVRFIDYDGTVVYGYTAAEFAQLTTMPANPSHTGLIAQGWNWSLADAQTYVASYGKLIVGQTYTTTSGATEIDIKLQEGRLTPYCGFAVDGTVTIDWGDGSTNTVTGTSTSTVINTQHTYASAGSYTIKLMPSSGTTYALAGTNSYGSKVLWKNSTTLHENKAYTSSVRSIRIGPNCLLDSYAFTGFFSLTSITIPNSIESIGTCAFNGCYSLEFVTIPNGVSTIENNTFYICFSLDSVSIPNSVTSIDTYAFNFCESLKSITIPSSVTTIGETVFQQNYTLTEVTVPSSLTNISYGMFYYCYSLTSVTIPSNVTSIGANAFIDCYSLGEIHFKPTTPPTVSNSNAWKNVPIDCKIYVPTGRLSAYTSATNYPSSSTYTYIEE